MSRLSGAAFKRFVAGREGATAVLWALSMPVLIGGAALSVDVGSMFLERRELQSASDAAALAAAMRPSAPREAAELIFRENGYPDLDFSLTNGVYREDPKLDRSGRFLPDPGGPDVRIDANVPVKAYFANFLRGEIFQASVRSEAQATATLTLSAGSRLASLREGAVNAALGNLLGTKVALTAADYRTLASAKLGLGSLLAALGKGTSAGSTVGAILDRRIEARAFVGALADGLTANGALRDAGVVRRLLGSPSGASASLSPAELIAVPQDLRSVDVNYPSKALSADIGVMSLLQAAITRNEIGNKIAAGLVLPGVSKFEVETFVGQGLQTTRPVAAGWVGTRIETGQVKLQVTLSTTGVVSLIGGLNVPVEAVVAGGSAVVVAAVCSPDPKKRSVTLDVRPGLARVEIGDIIKKPRDIAVSDQLAPAKVVNVLSARVYLHAVGRAQDERAQTVTFNGAEIGNGEFKTVSSRDTLSSLLASLVSRPVINVEILGLGIGLSDVFVKSSVAGLVAALATPLDSLFNEILTLAGIRLGEMDVRVDGMTCGSARLVG